MEIELVKIKKSNLGLLRSAKEHYVLQKGMPLGRLLCFEIVCQGTIWGYICAGGSTRTPVGKNSYKVPLFGTKDIYVEKKGVTRDKWFGISKEQGCNNIVDNVFFHMLPRDGDYPCRNFTTKILQLWRKKTIEYWKIKYGVNVTGFQTMVGGERTGETYIRDGWTLIGRTMGYSRSYNAGKYASKKKKSLGEEMESKNWTKTGDIKKVFVRSI